MDVASAMGRTERVRVSVGPDDEIELELDRSQLPDPLDPPDPPPPSDPPEPSASRVCGISRIGLCALVTFTIQHALGALLVRYTKTRLVDEYNSVSAVLMQELVVKLPLSLLAYSLECGGVVKMIYSLVDDFNCHRLEWLKMWVPAIVYTTQMGLLYVGYGNVEAAIGQITYQSKILFTAMFTVCLLARRLTANQWLALILLMLGVVSVQDLQHSKTPSGRDGQDPVLGTAALAAAALCSAFASVYFEKMLKTDRNPSLWLRNIQLAVYGSVAALVGLIVQNDPRIWQEGLLYGFAELVWGSVVWQAAGGLVVALTIKHADNLLRCFAQAFAILLIAVISFVCFGFEITWQFSLGSTLVIASVFLYGGKSKTPMESMQACCKRRKGRSWKPLEDVADSTTNTNTKSNCKVVACALFAWVLTLLFWGPLLVSTASLHLERSVGVGPPPPGTPPLAPPPLNWSEVAFDHIDRVGYDVQSQPPLTFPPLPPSMPLPPFPPAAYAPSLGCDRELNEWCRSPASTCNLRGQRFMLARLDRGAFGNDVRWRCYDPTCLMDEIQSIRECTQYCTRHEQLSSIQSRCAAGRYTLRRRAAPAVVSKLMVHLQRDGWKLRRIQTSVFDAGLNWDSLKIGVWPGVILSETPEVLDWATTNQFIQRPHFPERLGNLGAALAHIQLWENISHRPENEMVLVLEDNALFTRESIGALDHFAAYSFDFLNLRVLRPEGTHTDQPGVLRMPNDVYPHENMFYWMPNLWLSSYLITPVGARRLLEELVRVRCDMSMWGFIIDRCVTVAIHSSSSYAGYVVDHARYFGHAESHGDSRNDFNAG